MRTYEEVAASYLHRRAQREAEAERLAAQEAAVAWGRLGLFVAGLVVLWLCFFERRISLGWVPVPWVLFLALVVLHEQIIGRRRRRLRAMAFYDGGLARIEDRWSGQGNQGDRFADEAHPYASDLDLFGKGSLFELLCRARTSVGEETLSRWLKEPAPHEVLRGRQEAVDELRAGLELREELAVLAEEAGPRMDAGALREWAGREGELPGPLVQAVAAAVSTGTIAAAVAWALGLGRVPLLLGVMFLLGIGYRHRRFIEEMVSSVERAGRELRLLTDVVGLLEGASFAGVHLAGLQKELWSRGRSPSRAILKLRRLNTLLDSRRNQIFAPLAAVLLWSLHLSCAIERWRRAYGPSVIRWLEVVGEMEALSSLAAFAYEHPDLPFPDLVPEGPRLSAKGLGHPLIGRAERVINDLELGEPTRLLLVSGSNMSGKSTLLRTVGINVVLAQAGAPVCAEDLALSPLMPGATLHVHDSLQAGKSRFYAEIERLRRLFDLTEGSRALLFLLDEILHGTNSHDRRIGAESVVGGLLEGGAIGLVTTHDLALAEIADDLGSLASNVHFSDDLSDDGLVFDYRLKPGVVRGSNALALMRSVGLDLKPETPTNRVDSDSTMR